MLKNLFIALVRPHLEFSYDVWFTSSLKEDKKITKLILELRNMWKETEIDQVAKIVLLSVWKYDWRL